jgi:DNA-directed RNA polymerase subunit RPC12/RpoP
MNKLLNCLSNETIILLLVVLVVISFILIIFHSAATSKYQCPHCKGLFKSLDDHWCDELIKSIYFLQLENKTLYMMNSYFQYISFNYGCKNCGNKFTYKIFIPKRFVPPRDRNRIVVQCDKCSEKD